jgi:hypothetical protein
MEMGQETEVRLQILIEAVATPYAVSIISVYMQVGKVILDSHLDLDAPKHIMLMLFVLVDRKRPESFFKVRRRTLLCTYAFMNKERRRIDMDD